MLTILVLENFSKRLLLPVSTDLCVVYGSFWDHEREF
jgi:hypothetical protein